MTNNFNPSFVESQNVLFGDCILNNCVLKPTVRSDNASPTSRFFFQQESASPTDPSFRLLLSNCSVQPGSYGNVLRNIVQINIHPDIQPGSRTINLVNVVANVYGAPILWTRSVRLGVFCS